MKKIKYLAFICALTFASFGASANETTTSGNGDAEERAAQLEERVYEIWEMDFSDMDKSEKAALKKEVKEIKKELKQTGLDSKISMSVGLVIIILLLLIILT